MAMGRNKRNVRPSVLPPPATAEVQSTTSSPDPAALIADICKRSLQAILREDYFQVIRQLEKECKQRGSFALIHLLLADAHFSLGDLDNASSQQSSRHHHLKSAAASARKAADLSPSNFEFAFTYAQYLDSLAQSSFSYDDYAETVNGCERALAIAKHVEWPEEKPPQNWPRPPKSRSDLSISSKRDELVTLMGLSKVRALYALAEELGGVDISKNDNTDDVEEGEEKEEEVEPPSSRRIPERPSSAARKSQKNVKKQSKIGEVANYLRSSAYADLSDVLVVKVSDVEKLLCLQNFHEHATTFLEAVSFAHSNCSWEFWTCFTCNLKFGDGRSLTEHAQKKHMGFLSPELHSFLSKQRCADKLKGIVVDGVNLAPLDVPALLAMHKKEGAEKKAGAETIDSNSSDDYLFSDDLTFSDDQTRDKLLQNICAMIRMLGSYRVLSHNHLLLLWVYGVDGIRAMPSGPLLLRHKWDRLPSCLAILETPILTQIFEFLLHLSKRCKLGAFGASANVDNLADVKTSFLLPDPVRLYIAGDDPLTLRFDDSCFSADSGEKIDLKRMLDWLYSDDSFGECAKSWLSRRDQQRKHCNNIMQKLTDTCNLIFHMHKQTACASSVVNGLRAFISYLEEGLRQKGEEFDQQVASLAWRSVLIADLEKLNKQNLPRKKWDMEVILSILRHIRAADGEESVVKALQKLMPKLELEVHAGRAAILHKLSVVEEAQSKLKRASCCSYRQFVIPAVQFFLRDFLEMKAKATNALSDVELELFASDILEDKKKQNKTKQAPWKKKKKQGKK